MRRLPALVAGRSRWVLPMADRSAAVLAEVLLSPYVAELIDPLAERLAADPPLALWTVCVATRDNFSPRSVWDLARWLAEHASGALRWEDGGGDASDAPDEPDAERYAVQVELSLQVADMSALVAAPDGETAAQRAHLAGLLHGAAAWLGLVGDTPTKKALASLSTQLADVDQGPAAARVAEAVDILAGSRRPDSEDCDPDACRRRAGEDRRGWLETVPGVGKMLPLLAAKLARLEELQRQFQEALETEKLEAMAEFAAGAGHEINNPLAIIAGRAQLFLQDETDPERRRGLAVIGAQVRRAYEMIADMRLFARPPLPEPEPIDLVEVTDRLVRDLASQAADRAITLVRTGEDGPLQIEADGAQLAVALRAVCSNALEAIGRDGHVEIALHDHGHQVQIRITDDGPGMSPEERRHLFDPFYSARQAGRGLGLGLSKCWRIVTNHGGRIDVDSQPEHGATFTITLPRQQAAGSRQ